MGYDIRYDFKSSVSILFSKTFQNIQLFETKFNEALEKLVSERLRGNVPKTTTTSSEALITKEQFKKMDLVQRQKLFNNNRELYNELSKN